MQFHLKVVLICFIFLLNDLLIAQSQVIKIWKDKIPGAIESDSYKEEIIRTETGAERILKVTVPTLSAFFPAKEISNGTSVIICPGGGYGRLAFDHEGIEIAKWFNEMGVTAFILKYRLPNDTIMENKSIGPLQDVLEAIRIVRRNSQQWNINSNKIGVMGFSAGGHLASTASTHFDEQVYKADSVSARPDFSILIYPVISMTEEITHRGSRENLLGKNSPKDLVNHFSNELQVNENTPPAFLVHSAVDKSVPVQNSINYFLALKKFNIPAELHIYEKGGHGYGLARNKGTESAWPAACKSWMKETGLL